MADEQYPRDLCGYGETPPDARWPGGARIAVQFVVNYEEGAENCVLHGDPASEAFLSEIVAAEPIENQRHMNMESLYEYGARAGFWRLHRLFTERDLPPIFRLTPLAEPELDAVLDARSYDDINGADVMTRPLGEAKFREDVSYERRITDQWLAGLPEGHDPETMRRMLETIDDAAPGRVLVRENRCISPREQVGHVLIGDIAVDKGDSVGQLSLDESIPETPIPNPPLTRDR